MTNRYIALFSSALLALTLTACSSQAELTPKLQHALLTKPQSEQIAQGLGRLMHSQPFTVAEDVFTERSILVTDNLNQRDQYGNPIMGKQLNMPDRFELLIKDNLCFLRHLDSKATEPLPDVKCKINYK